MLSGNLKIPLQIKRNHMDRYPGKSLSNFTLAGKRPEKVLLCKESYLQVAIDKKMNM